MTPNQRKRALQKVHWTKISEASDGSLTQRPQSAEGAKKPILDRLLQEGIDWIPLSTLTGMTEKAEKILQVPDQVIPIPNSEGSLLISSKTNARNPHVVSAYSTGRIVCNCVNNKSLFARTPSSMQSTRKYSLSSTIGLKSSGAVKVAMPSIFQTSYQRICLVEGVERARGLSERPRQQ